MERRQYIRQQQTTTKTSTANGNTSLSIRNRKYEKLFKMRSESSSESSSDSSDSQESITSKQSDSSLASMSSSTDSSFSSTPQSTMLKARSGLMPDNAMEMIVQRLMSLKVPNLSRNLKSSPGDKLNSSRYAENGSDSLGDFKTSTRAIAKSASHVSHIVKKSGSHCSESDSKQAKPCMTSHARQTHKPPKSSPTNQNTRRALRGLSGTNRNFIVKRQRRARKSDEQLSPFKMYTITDDYPLNNSLALHPIQSESSNEPPTKNQRTRVRKVSPRNHGRIFSLDQEYQEEIEEVISLSTDDEVVQFPNKWEHLNEDETSRKVSNLFIVSLAVADVIVGIIVMPMSAFYIFTERWMLGVAVCQIWIGVDYTASTASILNLFILSLDRYWSVRQPLKYLHKRTKRRAMTMIGIVWAVSSLWIIPISSWHYFAHGGVRTVENEKCDTEYAKNSAFKLVTAFFNFYLPLSVMYILYFRIFIAIRKRSEFELGQRNPGGTVLSYKSNVPNSLDESDCNDDLSCSLDHRLPGGVEIRPRENGTRPHLPSGARNLRVLTMKRHTAPCSFRESNSAPYKVEYIYDENVIDPQTEKIERYYYEDHYPIPCLSRPTWVVGSEKYTSSSHRQGRHRSPRDYATPLKLQSSSSVAGCGTAAKDQNQQTLPSYLAVGYKNSAVVKRSLFRRQRAANNAGLSSIRLESYRKYEPEEPCFPPSIFNEPANVSSSSSSSASTFGDDHRNNDGSRDNCRSDKLNHRENYSVAGGVRKIRQVETFLDKTVGLGPMSAPSVDGSSRNGDDFDSVLTLHDEKNRRLTGGVTGLKERLKTMRQSSSLNKEIKAARQLGVIMGAFTLCFLPYFILFLVVAFCDDCVNPAHLTAATWVGYLNSTLNPFLYPLCNANFRNRFKSMLGCCGRGRSGGRGAHQDYCERNTAFNSRYD